MTGGSAATITLGPVLFNWPPDDKRDFYFRIAGEAPVDRVCLGEVVCAKRAPFFDPFIPEIAARLEAAGKTVVHAAPAFVTGARERAGLRDLAASGLFVEANDVAALGLLANRPHTVGPSVNVYNEATLRFLARRGARHIALPPELPARALAALAPVAAEEGVTLEVQVFGRLPLAISARCHHARAHGLHKDGCQYVCANDPDGLAVATLDGDGFLAVNGTQTLSYRPVNLAAEIPALRRIGVSAFRLSPHSADMVAAARLVRDVLDGRLAPEAAARGLSALVPFAPCANGFYHGVEGAGLVGAAASPAIDGPGAPAQPRKSRA